MAVRRRARARARRRGDARGESRGCWTSSPRVPRGGRHRICSASRRSTTRCWRARPRALRRPGAGRRSPPRGRRVRQRQRRPHVRRARARRRTLGAHGRRGARLGARASLGVRAHARRRQPLWGATGVAGLPDEDVVTQYWTLAHAAAARGFEHYEVSNYARPGRRSRHNLVYWRAAEYLASVPAPAASWATSATATLEPVPRYCAAAGRPRAAARHVRAARRPAAAGRAAHPRPAHGRRAPALAGRARGRSDRRLAR